MSLLEKLLWMICVLTGCQCCSHVMVHLRSLDVPEQRHPEAAHPVLYTGNLKQLSGGRPSPTAMSHIQIHKNLVAWIYSTTTTYCRNCDVEVWDWKAGRLLWVRDTFDVRGASMLILSASFCSAAILTVRSRIPCSTPLMSL